MKEPGSLADTMSNPLDRGERMAMQGISGGPIARRAMAYVLAGGRGSRLLELTDKRAKPAVYFGGKARIIDFALSNALNSGIRRIAVATQYKAHSLIRHLQLGWNFLRPERNESFDILPASQRVSEEYWYRGTADAVFQNIDIIQSYAPEYMVVLAGDHVYKMDYEIMLQQHVASGADVTVGCATVPRAEGTAFGVMHIDASDRIISFLEKPQDPPGMPDDPSRALVSMGIYAFRTQLLFDLLRRDAADPNSSHDFGKDIVPRVVREGKAVAHPFDRSFVKTDSNNPYWRDVGTVDAYFEANIDLTDEHPDLDLYDSHWPVWTYSEMTAPAKFIQDEPGSRGCAINSTISGGSIIAGAMVRKSVLFSRVKVNARSDVERAVILPQVEIGREARLRNVVIDRGVHIPDGLVVGEDPELDAQRFRRTENGVCLITRPMIERLTN
jgi:glucose-1-phosphate adenylyltransferase